MTLGLAKKLAGLRFDTLCAHLNARHADRMTGADLKREEQADALSEPPSETSRLIATDAPD